MLAEYLLLLGSAAIAFLPVLGGFADVAPNPESLLLPLVFLVAFGAVVVGIVVFSILIIRAIRKRSESKREE